MQVSAQAYDRAIAMLAFIKQKPGSHMQLIADNAGMLKATAHMIVQKMVTAGVLTYTTKRYRGGKRHYYAATGTALPPRIPVKKINIPLTEQTLTVDAVTAESLSALPSFIRAITPVIEVPALRAVGYYGHTQEQHLKQSAIMRQERKTRGVMYTGVARL